MKIVIAEDIGVIRRLLEETLSEMGHEVTAVADGIAAVAAVHRERPALVLLDWMMPKLDGLEVCASVRAMEGGDEIFILMQTGRSTTEDLAAALAAGVDDYITKPITTDHLRARIAIAETRMVQDAARRRAEKTVAHVQWLAGVGETSLAVQHEVNNPLTALLGQLAFALEATGQEETRRTLVAANEQAQRVTMVVNRLAHLEDPHSIEVMPGFRMLDLAPQPGGTP